MISVSILLIISLLTTFVSANIEQVRFLAPFTTTTPSYSQHDFPLISELNFQVPSVIKTIYPEFGNLSVPYAHEEWFLLNDLRKGSFYEFRVCWTANNPLDVKIGVIKASKLDPSHELYEPDPTRDRFYGFIKYSSFYYTHIRELMDHPQPVKIHYIFSKCTFLVALGDSVIMQALLVVLGVFGWKYASLWYYSWLRRLTGGGK
ncbi:hypothetical protein V1514DRAFT_11421 [Lipomyces japonicus]|uniref:uncharacterized protein n=1 Tax=Lipomyces japonicus TaxID=56871 RepID=UPI0034CDBD64